MLTHLAIIPRTTQISEADLFRFVGALDLQIRRDFAPAWGQHVVPWIVRDDKQCLPNDWRLYLWGTPRNAKEVGALGHHTFQGSNVVPVGHVFVQTCQDFGEPWTAIASHEALEMIADEWVNLCVTRQAPNGLIELWPREVCDAVQGVRYTINEVAVSDFVLPEYYIENADGPFDFCRALTGPFTVHPTGYTSLAELVHGKLVRRDVYGATYPDWRREERELSRKSARAILQKDKHVNAKK